MIRTTRATGVSLKHDEERGIGCVITLRKAISAAPTPLVLNTPFLAELDKHHPLPPAIVQQLDTIQAAAEDYVRGKRAQGDLFEEAG